MKLKRFISIAFLLIVCVTAFASPQRASHEFRTGIEKQPLHVLEYNLRGHFDWETLLLTASVDIRLKLDSALQSQILLDSEVSRILSVSFGGMALPFSPGYSNVPGSSILRNYGHQNSG